MQSLSLVLLYSVERGRCSLSGLEGEALMGFGGGDWVAGEGLESSEVGENYSRSIYVVGPFHGGSSNDILGRDDRQDRNGQGMKRGDVMPRIPGTHDGRKRNGGRRLSPSSPLQQPVPDHDDDDDGGDGGDDEWW
jgi:hypothetical protein